MECSIQIHEVSTLLSPSVASNPKLKISFLAARFALSIDDTFLFPYNEIVYIDGAAIMLAHSKMFYNERPAPIPRHVTTTGPVKYSFTRLQNPALFQRVVMALKQLPRDGTAATMEPSLLASRMDVPGNVG